ncbi:hypothetical protein EZV62_019388 [Acer yangbiense]|uniref:CCHC-type domain-containing protein n=1 Tax=Acer yangbiense TaxID=1000413 RepID=A0A5C7HCB9_9ROSI|nr:hypothetical protein EZV62_019388 [Acer yangbiense]
MDFDEISRLCASLSIKGKDEKLWSVKDTLTEAASKKLELCLVGKILSTKHINREAFRAVIPRIWQTNLGIEVVQDNIFLFYFHNQGEHFCILSGDPWSFDNCLLVLEKPSGVGEVTRLGFNRVAFWIQVINAPLLYMTKKMGEFIRRLIGELVDMDVGVTGECFGKYMRLRVMIDVVKPLKRFLRLELHKGEESMLLLRYEKLSEYCFHCGIIGHSYLECDCGQGNGRRDIGANFDFGPWLRVSSPPGQNKPSGNHRFRGENSSNGGGSRKGLSMGNPNLNRANNNWRVLSGGPNENVRDSINGCKMNKNTADLLVEEIREAGVGGETGSNAVAPMIDEALNYFGGNEKDVAKEKGISGDVTQDMHASGVDVNMHGNFNGESGSSHPVHVTDLGAVNEEGKVGVNVMFRLRLS